MEEVLIRDSAYVLGEDAVCAASGDPEPWGDEGQGKGRFPLVLETLGARNAEHPGFQSYSRPRRYGATGVCTHLC